MAWFNKLSILGLWDAGDPKVVSDTDPVPVEEQNPLTEFPLPAAQVTTLSPQTDGLTDTELRAAAVPVDTGLTQPTTPVDTQPVSGTVTVANPTADPQTDGLTDTELRATPVPVTVPAVVADGTWGYHAGTSGTLTMTGSKRVLAITATALGAAGSLTIDGGDAITLPYDGTDKASTAITIEPRGNLTDPEIIFTGTDAYFVEWVS